MTAPPPTSTWPSPSHQRRSLAFADRLLASIAASSKSLLRHFVLPHFPLLLSLPPSQLAGPRTTLQGVCTGAAGHAHGPAGAGHGRRRNALKLRFCRRVAPVIVRFAVVPCPLGSVPSQSRLAILCAAERQACTPELHRLAAPGLHAACSWRTEGGGLPGNLVNCCSRILLGSHPNISGAVPSGSVAISSRPTKPRSLGATSGLGTPETTGWWYTHIVQPNSMIFSITTRWLTCIYQAPCVVRSRGPLSPLHNIRMPATAMVQRWPGGGSQRSGTARYLFTRSGYPPEKHRSAH